MTHLLPCPFCGGRADFEEVRNQGSEFAFWSVGCQSTETDCIGYQMLAHYNRKCEAAEAWNKRAPVNVTFPRAMDIAEDGLNRWKSKDHNRKWWRQIDGTPIPNDLLVNIAEAFVEILSPSRSEGNTP